MFLLDNLKPNNCLEMMELEVSRANIILQLFLWSTEW